MQQQNNKQRKQPKQDKKKKKGIGTSQYVACVQRGKL